MELSLRCAIRQELRLRLICTVCQKDVPSMNGLPEEDTTGIFDAYAWKKENEPTELEWFLWKVANGYCPQCCGRVCSGQLPDHYVAKWVEMKEKELDPTYEEYTDAP